MRNNQEKKTKMKISRVILLTIMFCGVCTLTQAQTKSETKLYNTTKTKGDLKSINKFLSKYPNSIYAKEITQLKDSITFFGLNKNDVLEYINFCKEHPDSYYYQAANNKISELNTSKISDSQAQEITADFYGENAPKKSIIKSVKNFNKENIVVIWEDGKTTYNIEVITQTPEGWQKSNNLTEHKYISDNNLNLFEFVENCKVVTINGEQYIQYSYTNRSQQVDKRSNLTNNNAEYVINLYSINDNSVYSAMYSGLTNINSVSKPYDSEDFIIYGKCNDSAAGGIYATEQMKYLLRELSKNNKLQPFDKEQFIVQETIQWWYDNNPVNAKQLKFGAINKDNPIAKAFDASTQKEKVGNKLVNFFDIYNTTVIVAYDRADKSYTLVWCEPVAVKKSDAQLSNLYQDKQNTIALFYYKGNTAYKKRINLNNRTIY